MMARPVRGQGWPSCLAPEGAVASTAPQGRDLLNLDWKAIDRWLMGEAWTGARIGEHLRVLCDQIGPRWASSAAERKATDYLRDQFQAAGLEEARLEEFPLDTWACDCAIARLAEEDRPIPLLPFNRCPSCQVQAPIADVGFGTPRELEQGLLAGTAAVISLGHEPFTAPIPLAYRLQALARTGAAAAVVVDAKDGCRMEYHNAGDWRDLRLKDDAFPAVTVSREHGTLLRRLAGKTLHLEVRSRFYTAPTANVAAQLTGSRWPAEHLLLGGHHDTVYDSPGGNDNASGTIAVLETARVLAGLRAELGCTPGCSIRFVTFSAEEQRLQGSAAYVERHYGPEPPPRLAINLDELSTGNIKGVVLAFPHLREVVQRQLDALGDGLKCHVMSQLDPTSDHFPFLRAGLQAAHLWRWRFHRRHADAEFHHEPGDTADKVNVRELKEYIGQLARLLLRLSHLPPETWPRSPIAPAQVQQRLEAERGTVIRVF